jgi:hypothetical protein
VIEFDRRVLKIVQAVNDQDGDKRARRTDKRFRQRENRSETDDDRNLCRRIVGNVGTDDPVLDFD